VGGLAYSKSTSFRVRNAMARSAERTGHDPGHAVVACNGALPRQGKRAVAFLGVARFVRLMIQMRTVMASAISKVKVRLFYFCASRSAQRTTGPIEAGTAGRRAHTSRQGAAHGSVRSADRTVADPHRLGVQSILGQGGTAWRAMR
jgi:hypothetical protein